MFDIFFWLFVFPHLSTQHFTMFTTLSYLISEYEKAADFRFKEYKLAFQPNLIWDECLNPLLPFLDLHKMITELYSVHWL